MQQDSNLANGKRDRTPPSFILRQVVGFEGSSQSRNQSTTPEKGRFDKSRYHQRSLSNIKIRAPAPLLVALNVTNQPSMEGHRAKPFRRHKKYVGKDLELEFRNLGIMNLQAFIGREQWIPLEIFDDLTFEDFKPLEWMERARRVEGIDDFEVVPGRGLNKKDNFRWKQIYIFRYSKETGKFSGIWASDRSEIEISRLDVCFDEEDTNKFAKRVTKALRERKWADAVMRYNSCVDKMPTIDGYRLESQIMDRIERKVRKHIEYRPEKVDLANLKVEVSRDFFRAMNKVTFNKYLDEEPEEILFDKDNLPDNWNEIYKTPEHGKIQLSYNEDSRPFKQRLQEFSENSLFTLREAVLALKDVRTECSTCSKLCFYDVAFEKALTIDSFKKRQDVAITACAFYLYNTWSPKVTHAVHHHFQPIHPQIFNYERPPVNVPEVSKLRKVVLLTRKIMQDTVLTLIRNSFNKFFGHILMHTPHKIIVDGFRDVFNWYENYSGAGKTKVSEISFGNEQETHPPLFLLDIRASRVRKEFEYSIFPDLITTAILELFDRVLGEVRILPDPEHRIYDPLLQDLLQDSKKDRYLKTPSRPRKSSEFENDQESFRENQWLVDMFRDLRETFEITGFALKKYLTFFDKYKGILDIEPAEYIKKIDAEHPPRKEEGIVDEVKKYEKLEQEISEQVPKEIKISSFLVDCKPVITSLTFRYKGLKHHLIEYLYLRADRATDILLKEFQDIEDGIQKEVRDIEDLIAMEDYLRKVPAKLEHLQIEVTKCLKIYAMLEDLKYQLSETAFREKSAVQGGNAKIRGLIYMKKNSLETLRVEFEGVLKNKQKEFKKAVHNMERMIMRFDQYQSLEDFVEVSQIAITVQQDLERFAEQAKVFNYHESLAGAAITEYSKIAELQKDFAPYYTLWTTAAEWSKNYEEWMNRRFDNIDAEAAEKWVDDKVREIGGAIRFFKDKGLQAIAKITEKVKNEIIEFRNKVPLMVALRKKGITKRHWQEISEKTGVDLYSQLSQLTFKKLLDLGLMRYITEIVEIAERAEKEYMIQVKLDEMFKYWEPMKFEFITYKNSFIVDKHREMSQILDDQIISTQAMQLSPFKKPFEERLNQWNEQLLYMSTLIEEWGKCQVHYMYLNPIFDAPDISKQLPTESRRFRGIDVAWKSMMLTLKPKRGVLRICSREGPIEQLPEKLQGMNKELEKIQKDLANFLDRKRESFARFYFLSNDELLEIFSQVREPQAIQPFLKKIFENITTIQLNEQKHFQTMYAEKERIDFVDCVDPTSKHIEIWMSEIENMMKSTIRHVLRKSINEFRENEKQTWLTQHPGQCLLTASQIHWTTNTERAIKNADLEAYHYRCGENLTALIQLVRSKEINVKSLNSLIVIEVHSRDVIDKLRRAQVQDILDFEWVSQLRYYWHPDDCFVRCVQTNFPYGYEYLGNTPRLVITPLTDKCYITLMGALQLNLGGAPAGPAGTGKTETTKDLAKSLAKQCIVFNCSEGMDYTFSGKLFKGIASGGAWACFDEFNRINIEVLSVIAQQLLTLFSARGSESKEVLFEGTKIQVNKTFALFITLNPGYAGRTELPDNLKSLFRPVAMMVPDYTLIAEIMLYSFGFQTARNLAKKMTAIFRLSSEQLSSQDHYDYGMRAVRSVINAAGLLKEANPTMNEEKLLLKAIWDVNIPKFLKDDIPLFEDISKDLFPNVEKPDYLHEELLPGITKACEKHNLQKQNNFIHKTLQLYDTIQVRSGLMLVGPTGGGKTSSYRVLEEAMNILSQAENPTFAPVHTYILNPKSIKIEQLYGWINEQTKEWTDGILAAIVRQTVKDTLQEKHWVIFDGPVDALWIESMNTVLDDNKKLCLNSGEILALNNHTTMIFEVEDLAVASPATVSRCGMVFMEPDALGIWPLVESWIHKFTERIKLKDLFLSQLDNLFRSFAEPCINFVKKSLKQIVETPSNSLIESLLKLLDSCIEDARVQEPSIVSEHDIDVYKNTVDHIFMFSLVWSIGCTVDLEGRKAFDGFLRKLILIENSIVNFPTKLSVFDYNYNFNTQSFESWSETNKSLVIPPRYIFSDVVVPTSDSNRMIHLMKILIHQDCHTLCPGPTGVGKSLNIQTLLQHRLNENFQHISLTFSAQTDVSQVQDAIDSKLEKRRRGYFGPPLGRKFVVFVDDLNMPKKEKYGAQPPLELLRQYLDHKSWYDVKKLERRILEDVILIAAMGPPGGGRNFMPNRLTRHFNILAYSEIERSAMHLIFKTLLRHFLKDFNDSIKSLQEPLIETVLSVYQTVKFQLRPTPSKSFYTFNLRDVSRVFQGICSASPSTCINVIDLVRLWFHENQRVFSDRLTTSEDRMFFQDLLKSQFPKFNTTEEEILTMDKIIFTNLISPQDSDNENTGIPRSYIQVRDYQQFIQSVDFYLNEYNSEARGAHQMNLILFLDACEHVARICRILSQPKGNVLILGVGGSGRQSLAKLGNYIVGYKLCKLEIVRGYNINSWREDLKRCIMIAGIENKPVTFLVIDTQIIDERMLEDLNTVLNTGDVINLYKQEDLNTIFTTCRNDCINNGITPTKINMFSQYLSRVQRNIHFAITMTPFGEVFRKRIRMFPSLVNCTTIDWFSEWPEDALLNVGRRILEPVEVELDIAELAPQLVQMITGIHKSVEQASVKFTSERRGYNYVTPTSYLEQLNMFKTIYKSRQADTKSQHSRLSHGLEKLTEANEEVIRMEIELRELQPKLEQAELDLMDMMAKILYDKQEADERQKSVAEDEIEARRSQEEAAALQGEALEAVAEAQKTLDITMQDVKSLEQKHLDEIKAFKNPPEAVFWTLAGVCVMLGEKVPLKPVPNSTTGEKREDYFDYAKKELLINPRDFLKRLLDFAYSDQKNNIPPERIKLFEAKIKPEPAFQEEKVKMANLATKYLWGWVTAMYKYYLKYMSTKHLRERLKNTEKDLSEKTGELNIRKKELDQINMTIILLESRYGEGLENKKQLIKRKKECELRLKSANQLIGGLAEEKARWQSETVEIEAQLGNLPGDIVLAAGMINYAGPFTSDYRNQFENSWAELLDEVGLFHTRDPKMKSILGVPTTIQTWYTNGLPKDDNSVENAIIIENTKRWPLMIDPQNQANKFIKSLGESQVGSTKFDVIKASDADVLRVLELAIQAGKWILLENVDNELDISLEPIISQQVFKQAGSQFIYIGNKIISYNPEFRFFITTTLSQPRFTPETFVKLSVINFAITPRGLEEQMLARIVSIEDLQLEKSKIQIMEENKKARVELQAIQDTILKSLIETQGNILDDETLISSLEGSKKLSEDISRRVQISKFTEEQIDSKREFYRPLAFRASTLFFCINDLSKIDPMYQYSLQWFIKVFTQTLESSPAVGEIEQRTKDLNEKFMTILYENICRSLFGKHKLLFSFLLTIRILQSQNLIDPKQWLFFLTGYTGSVTVPPCPCSWIPVNSWPEIYRQIRGLSSLSSFMGFETQFFKEIDRFKNFYTSSDPEHELLPEPWQDNLNSFERILVIKTIRPDKVIPSIQHWISQRLGSKYTEPHLLNLHDCYLESEPNTPIVFILSPGSDPLSNFLKFAEEMGFRNRCEKISLGQGQGPKAEKMIRECANQKGGWILLQNCHLAASWMPNLQKIVDGFGDQTKYDFRLWLTSLPTPHFPVQVLQSSIKLTFENPIDLKSNLLKTYTSMEEKDLEESEKPRIYKKLLFGLAMFHAVVLERKKFGPIGWNIPYEFTDDDFLVCKRQLQTFLGEYKEVPYKVLNYLGSEINYGGRVTDEKDVRLIKTILKTYITREAIIETYKYSESGLYYSPRAGDMLDYFDYIKGLPSETRPEVFGLHENAEIITAEESTRVLLSTLLLTQTKSFAQDTRSSEDVIANLISRLEDKIPPSFDFETIYQQYPTNYIESMNTVLIQEIIRYNRLLEIISPSLVNLKKALKGELLMSEELEEMLENLHQNQVPEIWKAKSFLSLKPLTTWIDDLNQRIKFFNLWIQRGTPQAFWVSGFFFPQAFFTGVLQNYARKYKVAIDRLSFSFKMLQSADPESVHEKPLDGCYIYGLFLEGARWDLDRQLLGKSLPQQLYTTMPLIWLLPIQDKLPSKQLMYHCPIYKVLSRAGTLSTTGHSTNFVTTMELPTIESEDTWVKAGVAAFLSLRY